MMIKESLKLSASLARTTPVFRAATVRSFAGAKILDEKEKGDERVYFKRQEGMFMHPSSIIFICILLSIDERLKRLQESLKKQGFEQVPSEIQRSQETLTLIFKQFELDPIGNKALYDTLIDWKRTL
jgi:hypothetical protein